MQGCFLDAGSLGQDLDWSCLRDTADQWQWHHNSAYDAIPGRITGADVVVTNKVVLDGPVIGGADTLKLICIAATGVNNVDLDAAAARGIPVVNVTDYATTAVAQHVLALMLARATRWATYDAAVRRGAWSDSEFFCRLDYPIVELAGQTLGIVGHGAIGQAVAALARAFGMTVLIAERPGRDRARAGRVVFEQILERADIISLHCPLTAATRRLIDADALQRMKPNTFLINTARGGLIDDKALIDALDCGRIGAAAVDVLDTEPPAADHPLLTGQRPNLIITPHSAWASRTARQRLLEGLAANIRDFKQDKTPNRVT